MRSLMKNKGGLLLGSRVAALLLLASAVGGIRLLRPGPALAAVPATLTSHPGAFPPPGSGIIQPAIATTGNLTVPVGSRLFDTAFVSGSSGTPAGTVTFRLFAPSDPNCRTAILTSKNNPLDATGHAVSRNDPSGQPASSPGYTAETPGPYRWLASYGGDHTYHPVASACGEESVTVLDGRIVLAPLSATDVAGRSQAFAATVQTSSDDVTWTAVPAVTVSWTLTNSDGATACFTSTTSPRCGKPPSPTTASCTTDPTGACSETISSTKPGSVTIHVTSTFGPGLAFPFTRSSGDGAGQDSPDAVATYVKPGPQSPPGPPSRAR